MTVLARRIYKEIKSLDDTKGGTGGSIIENNDFSMLVTVIASEIRKKVDLDVESVKRIKEEKRKDEESESSDDDGDDDDGKGGADANKKKHKEYFM